MQVNQYGKVAVLCGGRSAEREVSLKSGAAVLAALVGCGVDAVAFDPAERGLHHLREEGYDRAFIALHGRYGEDGTVQGALELLDLPYTGSGVLASALAMDKWQSKLIWRSCGLAVPAGVLLDKAVDGDLPDLPYPLMVKPVNEGSSIGMSKVNDADGLRRAVAEAQRYDSRILLEHFVSGRELTVGILDGKALPVIQIETAQGIYDYQTKYFATDTRYHCPSGLAAALETRVQELALAAFASLGCSGWGRVDIMLDGADNPWLLEVNTAPGMTDHSLVPMAARVAGLSFAELVLRILDGAHVG